MFHMVSCRITFSTTTGLLTLVEPRSRTFHDKYPSSAFFSRLQLFLGAVLQKITSQFLLKWVIYLITLLAFYLVCLCCLMLGFVHPASWPLTFQRFPCLYLPSTADVLAFSMSAIAASWVGSGEETEAIRLAKPVPLPAQPSLKLHYYVYS